jgi:hypothetical protein
VCARDVHRWRECARRPRRSAFACSVVRVLCMVRVHVSRIHGRALYGERALYGARALQQQHGVHCCGCVHCCVCGSMAYTAAAAAAWHRASLQSCTQLLVSVQAAARLRGPCLADEPQCGLPRGGLASAWGLVVHWNSGQRHLHVMHRSCARHECAVLVSVWSQMPPAGPAARRTRTAGRPYEHPMTQ